MAVDYGTSFRGLNIVEASRFRRIYQIFEHRVCRRCGVLIRRYGHARAVFMPVTSRSLLFLVL
jgi:hypothetical protein